MNLEDNPLDSKRSTVPDLDFNLTILKDGLLLPRLLRSYSKYYAMLFASIQILVYDKSEIV